MDLVIITLFYLGILMFVIGYFQSKQHCPKPKTVVKFIDYTLAEQQLIQNQEGVYERFLDMFSQQPILI
jgi:hypothetical protein